MGVLGVKTTKYTNVVISVIFASGIFAANACSAPPSVDVWECLPNPLETSPRCAKPIDAGTDAELDAGTDAELDAGTDAASVKDDAGLQPSVFATCTGDCVPEASGPTALDWTWEPLVVWFGSKSEVIAKDCPPGTPYLKSRAFDKLVAPAAKCDACACLPQGSCTELPSTIEIRSGKCNVSNVQTTPFDGPTSWDGTCTSVNAMAAGKLCNGVPCAQSISASKLPGPTNESCAPTTEKPNATIIKHEWLEGALACGAKDLVGTCAVTPEHCVETLPDGWLHCLARSGKHDVCPDNYNEYGPRWFYGDNPIDDRGCSACACGTPKDSICIGSFRLYSDSSCATEINKYQIASTDPPCWDLSPPGLGLGSKAIVNLSYLPGMCAVTGGEPIGTAIPNEAPNTGAVTYCCRAPSPPPDPPPR